MAYSSYDSILIKFRYYLNYLDLNEVKALQLLYICVELMSLDA